MELADRLAALTTQAILGLLRVVPEGAAMRIGAAIGKSYARLRGPRTGDAMTNLRIAFPDMSDADRRELLVRSFDNLGRNLTEFARLGLLDEAQLLERVRVEGLEHLEAAQKATDHGGVVILTGHFGSWELMAAAMVARGIPVAAVHRPRDNAFLDAMVAKLRSAGGATLLARGNAARAALDGLKRGFCLAMTYDQNCRRKEGVFVPFFGRLACTRDGPPRIATRTGSPVVPVFIYREPDGLHHVARFSPALDFADTGDKRADVVENARRMTVPIEEAIREAPDQWIWIHRRYRTQPEGEAHPY